MKNRKNIFGITFDPAMQPGHQTRNKSLDSLIGDTFPKIKCDESDGGIFNESNLRDKFKSGLDIRITPSVILRKKGVGA